jgi:hypothetical protein
MMIGLAVAALLQIGAKSFSPIQGVVLAARQIDWVEVQTKALTRLFRDGPTLLIH